MSTEDVRLTHSKSGLPCTTVLPAHHPLDGKGFNGPAVCSSHAEHVERGLPHVCCCGFVVRLNDVSLRPEGQASAPSGAAEEGS